MKNQYSSENSFLEPTVLTDDEVRGAERAIRAGLFRTKFSTDIRQISFVEGMESLVEPKLAFLYKLWLEKAHPETGLHNRADFDMFSMLPAVGNIMILDVLRNGFDARYRLYGTEISDSSSRDWTGYTVSEMNRTKSHELALMYRAVYLTVYETNRPVYCEHQAPIMMGGKIWRRLILPVSFSANVCEQFIVGNIPLLSDPTDNERKNELF